MTKEKYIQVETDSINSFSYRSDRIVIESDKPIRLAVEVDRGNAQFYYGIAKDELKAIGESVEADRLSDDYIKENGKLAFTGGMVGICAQDMDSHNSFADFDISTI